MSCKRVLKTESICLVVRFSAATLPRNRRLPGVGFSVEQAPLEGGSYDQC